ncbi:NAD(P)/FAD-dependent oxidoreductase [Porticoccaceae bacterium]|nr:NAD(P)/FAD-dependent oxidoreductase [Porticoccaceae bacterium]MDC0011514.1 NAD(P)/FAD-dependent oxidoreductase [Porticoccaceae bacterium]MDC1453612.1 NAD(P)/FAD-dependent oxidoreductase [Porticoccaceae bacterium]
MNHFDMIIIGAGLSGIGAACHLQSKHPNKSYKIIESRERMGGTWDLFRYPGVRSDSDMHTLGYSFKPWLSAKSIADGPAIRDYIKESAAEFGVDQHIQYERKVVAASWDSATARWTLTLENNGDLDGSTAEPETLTCNFIYSCTGYYRYDQGFTPDFADADQFKGQIVHPQLWPQDLDYSGKRVIVIGSGATAITLVPSLAKTAGHVTMLQRSPTYVLSSPDEDAMSQRLRRWFPEQLAYDLTRWKNVTAQALLFQLSRRYPNYVKKLIRKVVQGWMGDDFDIDTHFNPSYKPWDQRLCLVPNGDLFRSLRKGTSSIVTDHIERFTENGIQLKSGETLEADIIVTATGLELLLLGGLKLEVDGVEKKVSDSLTYKGMMFSGIPNFALAAGYTNASWTLKCDLTSHYVCRLISYMDKHQYQYCVANNDPSVKRLQFLDLASGYVDRAMDQFPKQGDKSPWKLHQNYLLDIFNLRLGSMRDKAMGFYKAK